MDLPSSYNLQNLILYDTVNIKIKTVNTNNYRKKDNHKRV